VALPSELPANQPTQAPGLPQIAPQLQHSVRAIIFVNGRPSVVAGVSEETKVLPCQPPAKGDQKGVNANSFWPSRIRPMLLKTRHRNCLTGAKLALPFRLLLIASDIGARMIAASSRGGVRLRSENGRPRP
jgi:hypothetical protein